MVRKVDGPEITGQVFHKQTGQAYGPVTVAASPKVYTDPEMSVSATTLTSDGTGVFSCYAPPGTYTFTTAAVDAATIEPVEVLGREGGTGTPGIAAYQPAQSVTPPGSPAINQTWLSSAFEDVRVPPGLNDRRVVITPPSWSSASMQEISLIQANGRINMLFTGNTGVGYAYCTDTADPLTPGSWTHSGSGPVIGNGVAGVAGLVNHGSQYIEGNTVYYFANVPADNTIKCWTAAITDLTTWTLVGTVIALQAGMTVWGNVKVVKDGATYRMLVEYKETSSGRWQMGMASCATVSGTYVMAVAKYSSLWPDATDRAGAGGPTLIFENSKWVLYYHASINWSGLVPCEIFRATSTDLTTDAWTLTDNSQPIIRRIHANEVDQVADCEILRLTTGEAYALWVGVDNRTPFTARVLGARLVPTRKRWNGTAWQTMDANPDSTTATRLPTKARYDELVADFAGTATAWAAINDGHNLGFTVAPTGTDLTIRLTGVMSPTGSVGFKYWFRVNRGAGTEIKTLGALNGTGGNRLNVALECRFTKLTPGRYYGFTIEYQIDSGGGTLNCRPVALAGQEQLSVTAVDAAYPA